MKQPKISIGIDVSKNHLDIFLLPDKKYLRFTNTQEGIHN